MQLGFATLHKDCGCGSPVTSKSNLPNSTPTTPRLISFIFWDGIRTSDRPVGIKRNAGNTPPQYNADLRYSRFFNFTERYRLEAFGEFQNLFNINSIVQYNNVTVTTNATTGELIGSLPDFRALNQSTAQDSRQFQIGLKFIF